MTQGCSGVVLQSLKYNWRKFIQLSDEIKQESIVLLRNCIQSLQSPAKIINLCTFASPRSLRFFHHF